MMTHPTLMLELSRAVTAVRISDAEQRATVDTDRSLIDQLMVMCVYREWKEAAADVSAAYSRCLACGATERGTAFAAYCAALDREEAAARAFAERVASLGNVGVSWEPGGLASG